MKYTERVHFKLFKMPCCGQLLCWVNPRLPTFCPECGKSVFIQLKTYEPDHTLINDEEATLTIRR